MSGRFASRRRSSISICRKCGRFPLIINVHGGGFMMGDKSNPPGADEFLADGYAVASVDYRLSGEALAPAQIQDVKAAVRFLPAMPRKNKLNPTSSRVSVAQQAAAWWRSWGLRAVQRLWKGLS